jgi:hypothetical protein
VALAIWTAFTPGAQRPDYSALAAKLGQPDETRVIVSQSGFASPLPLYLKGTEPLYPAPKDLAAAELVVVGPKPEHYALGPCWWLVNCTGTDIVSQPVQYEDVPPAFRLVEEGTAGNLDYSVYRAPRRARVKAPPAQPLMPRVYVQSP